MLAENFAVYDTQMAGQVIEELPFLVDEVTTTLIKPDSKRNS